MATPLILLYLIAFLDRVNTSFAALTMNRDLGFSDTTFGLASGIFFLGYMLFAVPSNVMLARFGPRHWMAFLMVTWGLLSGSMAFLHTPTAYVVIRFLIGAAEAGFFPGIVFYLTQWLPSSARAGLYSLFFLAVPLSSIVGSPISAKIMQMNGAHGLAGWQWLFLLEAVPAVVLGALVPLILTPSPAVAGWLSVGEKEMLAVAMAEDEASKPVVVPELAKAEPFPLSAIGVGSVIYFFFAIGLYALGFWVPRLLTSHGVKLAMLGWETALPFAVGAVGMYFWSAWSDRTGERRKNHAGAMVLGGVGLALTAVATSVPMTLLGLSIAAVGVFAALPLFWAGFSQRISVAYAAVGIASVNSLGNIGGFVGPYATGWLLTRTHGYASGLLATAVCLLLGATCSFFSQGKRAA